MGVAYDSQAEVFAEVFQSGSWSDKELAAKFMLDMLDEIEREAPDDWYNRIGSAPTSKSFKPKWVEEDSHGDKLVGTLSGTSPRYLTITGDLFGETATRTNLYKLTKENGTLMTTVSGVNYRAYVVAVDGTNPVLTVAALNSGSLPSNDTGMTWEIVGEPGTETEEVKNPRWQTRDTRWTASQLMWDNFEITKSRKLMKMEVIGESEFEHQIRILLRRLKHRFARTAMIEAPVLSAGAIQTLEDTATPRMAGFIWWMESLFGSGGEYANTELAKDMSGNPITDISFIDDMAYALLDIGAPLEQDGWEFLCNPRTYKYLADFNISERVKEEKSTTAGYSINQLQLKARSRPVSIYKDRNVPKHMAFLYHHPSLKKGKIEGYNLDKGQLPVQNLLFEKWQIWMMEYGLVARNAPVLGGYFFNMPNS